MSTDTGDAAFNEIMAALWQLRTAFLKNGMQPPNLLELGDVKDGDRFRYLLPKDLVMQQPYMGDTKRDARWVCNIMGIKVTVPAEWHRDLGGKDHLV